MPEGTALGPRGGSTPSMPWFLAEFTCRAQQEELLQTWRRGTGKLNASDVVLPGPIGCVWLYRIHKMMQSAPHRQGECMSDMT